MLRQLRKTAGSPESGLPASNINAADGYENQLSATAEMINTSSARGTAAFTLKVNPSLFSCVNLSTEISEFLDRIAFSPKIRHGSTVTSSWAVAVLRSQNEPSLYALEKMPEQRKKIYILSRNEGLSNEEIATQLNTTKRNVESQLSLALKEIRKTISCFFLSLL